MSTATNPYVTADEERTATDIAHMLTLAFGIAENLVSLVQEGAEQLRKLDLKVEPRRTVTMESDFFTDFAGTQYGAAHQALNKIIETFEDADMSVRQILVGEFDSELNVELENARKAAAEDAR